ncbi:hypothetical protein GCM10010406_33450 [Streptomyces thermolineatus]|uniref:Uncharacterized protein n=1 Tax=Streptomyces thermolineatus TaxID=44033 RepID=A0ABN3M4I0_9ACTN
MTVTLQDEIDGISRCARSVVQGLDRDGTPPADIGEAVREALDSLHLLCDELAERTEDPSQRSRLEQATALLASAWWHVNETRRPRVPTQHSA